TDDITDFASSPNSNTDNETPQLKSPYLLRENLKFNSTWLITYLWLRCDNFKEQSLKRHLNNKDHQKTLQTQSKEQLNILIQHNIATNTITDLCSLIDQQIQNSQELHISSNINILKSPFALKDIELTRSNYSSYTNNHAERDFINAIGEVIEQKICYEIHNSSVWSLMIDESNMVTREKTLAIVSKYITSNILSSYERMEILKMVEKQLDDSDLHLLRIVKTCWLFLSNVVSNLH
ncbi:14057_t:CDS:2, partial [Dentiscutata heterogama]